MVDIQDGLLEEVVYKQTTSSREEGKASSNLYIYLVAAIANLMALSAGISLAWVSPVLPKLTQNTNLTDNPLGRPITEPEASWIASLLNLGSVFGPMLAGTADRFGRKRVLLVTAFLVASSFAVTAFARTISLIYISRFLLGVCAGNIFAVLPMFLGEIAENHNRGALTCSMSIFVSSGINFAYIVGSYLSVRSFSLACTCPSLIFLLFFSVFGPESPIFLASTNKEAKLRLSLRKLRNKADELVEIELTELMSTLSERPEKSTVREMFRTKTTRKALIISAGLVTFQQFCGFGAIISYMQVIFDATGVQLSSQISSIIVGSVQMFATMFAAVVVDKVGRRVLLLSSALGMSVTVAALGLYFHLKYHQFHIETLSWLPVTSLIVFMMSFSFGIGPVPWAVIAEIFPPNVRSNAAALCSFSCFLSGFIIVLLFPSMSKLIGMANCFWIFAGICVVLYVFVYALLPETKGKGFQEIQKLLESKK